MADTELRAEIEYTEMLSEQLETYYQLFYNYYAETTEKPEKVMYDKDMFIRAMTDIQDKVEVIHQRMKALVKMAFGEKQTEVA